MMYFGFNFADNLPATNPPKQKNTIEIVNVMDNWDKDQSG